MPGSTVAPAASITSVSAPACRRASSSLPTHAMRPSSTAMALAHGTFVSTV